MIDFLKYRVACAIYSVCLIAAFAGTYFYKANTRGQAFTYSIDFTGGTPGIAEIDKPIHSNSVKEAVEKAGWPGAVIRDFSTKK